MPLFEYECKTCRVRFTLLVGVVADERPLVCPKCGGTHARKLVSRFALAQNEDDRLDALADRMERMGDDADPRMMREMARELGQASDDDMGDEMEEMLDSEMMGDEAGDDV